MTHHIEARRTMAVPADDLWHTISRMHGMEDGYPGFIAGSEVSNPDAPQPRRICTMTDGGTLKERILVRDHATRTFVYAIDEHPRPARNRVGSLRVDDLGKGRSAVSWGTSMARDDARVAQLEAVARGIYESGLDSLERRHAG